MKNNRKQKIENMLDSLSQKELEDYMSKREFMNIKIKEMLNTINTNRKYNHSQIISNKLSNNIQESIIYKNQLMVSIRWAKHIL